MFGTDDDDDGDSVSSRNGDVSSQSGSGEDGHNEDFRPVTQKQFKDLLGAVKKSFDKIESVREEIVQSKEETTKSIEKRCKKERTYEFKSKGNRIQYELNEDVSEQIELAESCIGRVVESKKGAGGKASAGKKDLVKAQEALKDGKSLLVTRQKHIKIADRSDHGWITVAEYQDDELASNSEDKKRIEKAEKAAERKAVKSRKRKAEAAANKVATKFARRDLYTAPRPGVSGNSYLSRNDRGRSSGSMQIGPCHNCQQMGHLKRDCLKPSVVTAAATTATGKWYPFESVEGVHGGASVASEGSGIVQRAGSAFEGWLSFGVMSLHDYEAEKFEPKGREAGCSSNVSLQRQVKGSLRHHVTYWANQLRAPSLVIAIIKEGYRLPLFRVPPRYNRPNDPSTFQNVTFVTDSVRELLASQRIKAVQALPHVCSPLLVVVNESGKKRLVINLRFLNQYLLRQKFKYEDLRTALDLLSQEDFLFKFDLKSGYHHIDIHPEHTKYLGFEWGGLGMCLLCCLLALLRPVLCSPRSFSH